MLRKEDEHSGPCAQLTAEISIIFGNVLHAPRGPRMGTPLLFVVSQPQMGQY